MRKSVLSGINEAAMQNGERADRPSVGERLREARRERGLTLAEVAERTGVSAPTLSKIENGRVGANFNTILRIAEAMQVPVTRLIGPAESGAGYGRRSITRSGQGKIVSAAGGDFELLCDEMMHRSNTFCILTVTCRSIEEFGQFSKHPGEEFLRVLSGELMLWSELYVPMKLCAGDSILFDSNMGHAYVCSSTEPAVVIMSNTLTRGDVDGFVD